MFSELEIKLNDIEVSKFLSRTHKADIEKEIEIGFRRLEEYLYKFPTENWGAITKSKLFELIFFKKYLDEDCYAGELAQIKLNFYISEILQNFLWRMHIYNEYLENFCYKHSPAEAKVHHIISKTGTIRVDDIFFEKVEEGVESKRNKARLNRRKWRKLRKLRTKEYTRDLYIFLEWVQYCNTQIETTNKPQQFSLSNDVPEETETTLKSTRKKGRRTGKSFDECILLKGEEKEKFIKAFRELTLGKVGKGLVVFIKASIKQGYIEKPTYNAVSLFLGDIGVESGYNNQMAKENDPKEIEGAINALIREMNR